MNYRFVLLGLVAIAWVPGVVAVDVLVATSNLSLAVNQNQYLRSMNGQYSLLMRPDCNLVVYDFSKPFLATNITTSTIRNCSLELQQDGNLAVYNLPGDYPNGYDPGVPVSPVWTEGYHANLSDGLNPFLLMGSDGSFEFYNTNITVRQTQYNSLYDSQSKFYSESNLDSDVWNSTFNASDPTYTAWTPYVSLQDFPYLPTEYFISAGNRLATLNQTFSLQLGSDCNLQLTRQFYEETPLWESSSQRANNSACQLKLQRNGVLQIYDVNTKEVYWNSTNNGDSESDVSWILKMNQDNGTLSIIDIKDSRRVLWTNVDALDKRLSKLKPMRPMKWIVVGVVGGAFVLAMAALGLYFYALECFLDPSEKAFQARLRAKGGKTGVFSQAKIKQATKNYENMIGRGGFGDVLYGKLPDGQEVAAKVLSASSHQSKQEFYNEIELLAMVHHNCLVSLLGHSCTRKHQILIYEYMAGGDLRHRLQGESGAENNPLSWRQRTNIILQVAEGLEYLHDKCSPPIIHRDVKSTNILLTDKLEAKVADFGLSKLKTIGHEDATHVTTVVKGTPGYLDPEYHETGMLTEKSDVYAFGVVLMEVLTGRHHMFIAQKVGEAWRQGQCDGLADPNVGEDFDREELVGLVELALWCVRRSSAERPFMRQVVRRLQELGLGATSSEPSQPEIELGEERQHHTVNIEMLSILGPETSASEMEPLSESSPSGLRSEILHGGAQIRSRSRSRREDPR